MKPRLLVLPALLLLVGGVLAADSASTSPKPIAPKMPVYPAALTDTGLSGAASIELLVQADGSVQEARVKSADNAAFGYAALATVRSWHFAPGMMEGTPVPVRMSIPFQFKAPFDQQLNARLGRKVFQPLPQAALTAKTYGRKIKLKKNAEPIYSRQFIREKLEDTVEVRFVVAPDGTTLNPVVAGQSRVEFKMAAIAAIAQCTYEPPVKDGLAVYVEATRTLTFSPPVRRSRRGGDDIGGGDDFGGDGFGGGGFGGGGNDPGGGW